MSSGRLRKLSPAKMRYIRKAVKLRNKLTNKALAHKFGVSTRTIIDAAKPGGRRIRPVPRGTSAFVTKLLQRISA